MSIAVVDPLRSHRDALCRAVESDLRFHLAASAATVADLADEVIGDLHGLIFQAVLPGIDLAEDLDRITSLAPTCRTVLCLSSADDDLVDWSHARGVHVVATADDGLDALLDALGDDDPQPAMTGDLRIARAHQIAAEMGITDRELEILWRLSDGDPPQRIAHEFGRSTATVRDHLQSLRTKLRCSNAVELVVTAHRLGLLPAIGHPRRTGPGTSPGASSREPRFVL